MALFIIVATRRAEQISTAIKDSGLAYYVLKDDTWLVVSSKTTIQLAESLGIRGGQNGSGLVCLVENYNGRLPNDAWEWLRSHETKND